MARFQEFVAQLDKSTVSVEDFLHIIRKEKERHSPTEPEYAGFDFLEQHYEHLVKQSATAREFLMDANSDEDREAA